jgi:hypothetical protein
MLEQYNDEYNWMLKNKAGYYPWIESHQSTVDGVLRCRAARGPAIMLPCSPVEIEPRIIRFLPIMPSFTPLEITQRVVRSPIQSHPLLDIFFKSLIRAEIRLISRYIPQRSHEERLTGHFVSEIDNAVNMLKDTFLNQSKSLYGEEKMIDFFYMDLSRGGKIEKTSGADLGFILVVDLPDFPFLVKSMLFQAKKFNGSASINNKQLATLKNQSQSDSAYLFYDTDLKKLTSPIVETTQSEIFENKSGKQNSKTFSINRDAILEKGEPFSLFVMDMLRIEECGKKHPSFDAAYKALMGTMGESVQNERAQLLNLGVVSLGKPIRFSFNAEEKKKSGTEDNEESETENAIELSI